MKTQFMNSHASSNSSSEDILNLQIRKPTVSKRHALRIFMVGGGGGGRGVKVKNPPDTE